MGQRGVATKPMASTIGSFSWACGQVAYAVKITLRTLQLSEACDITSSLKYLDVLHSFTNVTSEM